MGLRNSFSIKFAEIIFRYVSCVILLNFQKFSLTSNIEQHKEIAVQPDIFRRAKVALSKINDRTVFVSPTDYKFRKNILILFCQKSSKHIRFCSSGLRLSISTTSSDLLLKISSCCLRLRS